MNKINIKNPLTIFTSSLKTEGVNLIVEAEEVEVIEEEEMYFYLQNKADNSIIPFVLPNVNITFYDLFKDYGVLNGNNYYFYYAYENNNNYLSCPKATIDKEYDGSVFIHVGGYNWEIYPTLYTRINNDDIIYYDTTQGGGGSN